MKFKELDRPKELFKVKQSLYFFKTNRFGDQFFRRSLDWNASCGYTSFKSSKSISSREDQLKDVQSQENVKLALLNTPICLICFPFACQSSTFP